LKINTGFFTIALAAAVIGFVPPAVAQNYRGTPTPTVPDYGLYADNTSLTALSRECGNPLGACIFYGGDYLYDPSYSSIAGGLDNQRTLVETAYTWVPFIVPAGETWDVRGLFTNNASGLGVLDQGVEPRSVAYWSINSGVFAGHAGMVVDSGTSPATSTPTGRTGPYGLTEYTVQVTGLSVTLTPGSYWMIVVPICMNSQNPNCNEDFFISDVEYINRKPTNAFGPTEPIDASFLESSELVAFFAPTNGPQGACLGVGCDAFSAGVLGRVW
jgi:hypothetical protein